jgi:hypothetical protein
MIQNLRSNVTAPASANQSIVKENNVMNDPLVRTLLPYSHALP